jgi:hypothetical protein
LQDKEDVILYLYKEYQVKLYLKRIYYRTVMDDSEGIKQISIILGIVILLN